MFPLPYFLQTSSWIQRLNQTEVQSLWQDYRLCCDLSPRSTWRPVFNLLKSPMNGTQHLDLLTDCGKKLIYLFYHFVSIYSFKFFKVCFVLWCVLVNVLCKLEAMCILRFLGEVFHKRQLHSVDGWYCLVQLCPYWFSACWICQLLREGHWSLNYNSGFIYFSL